LADDVVLELLVAALLRGRERIVAQLVLDVLVLQAAQPLVGVGDVVEGLHHLGLELGLDGGKRERVLHIVVVEIAFGRSLRLPLAVTFLVRSCRRRLKRGGGGVGGVGVCASAPGTGTAGGAGTIGWPSGPIPGAGMALASG